MSSIRKLYYIANIRLPTEKAHGLQIMKMCESFSSVVGGDWAVELVVPRRLNTIRENVFRYYDVRPSFSITFVPCLDLINFLPNKVGFIIQMFSFLFFARLYLLFKKYDLIYTRDSVVALLWRCVVLELHSLPRRITGVYRFIWKRAVGIVVLTAFIKKKLIEVKIDKRKIIIAPDAVDLGLFDIFITKEMARQKLGLPLDFKLIGYVGMLRTIGMEKGLKVAIESLNFLSSNYILVIVGGSEEDIEFYKLLTDQLCGASRVKFNGIVSHSLVPLYLKSFDILIAPFPDFEHYRLYMSPMKLFEYMASKRPIVISDLPSIHEIVDESSVFFVKPDDALDLARGIEIVSNDSSAAKHRVDRAFKIVNNFTWEQRARHILILLDSIIEY